MRFAAGLAIVVAIPMAVLFYFQFRSLNDIEKTSAVVLRQLSSDTAESLTRSIEEHLKRPHISVLLRVPQASTEPLDLAWIDPVFGDGLKESPFVDAFCVWTERGPQARQRWLVFDRASNGAARRVERSLPGRLRCSARRCCRDLQDLVKTRHGHRRLHRRHRRPEALRAGAVAI